ncbi:MAG: phosphotransferase [Verrucomicrobiota bacterium]
MDKRYQLGDRFEEVICSAAGASAAEVGGVLQELWSGYGKILRVRLEGSEQATVVVKHVRFPDGGSHPRGWDTDLSHERKVRSYEVETNWYRDWSGRCGEACRVPRFFAGEREGDELLLVLEDLDGAGYAGRRAVVEWEEMECCLRWLASFHATFLGDVPEGLWEVGTYWHLATRPEELEVLADEALKAAAEAIDERLSSVRYRTLVHGDAKLANFCFSGKGDAVTAVDFQYVGGGCGMKDVAYFVGSCLDESGCAERETAVLECYFSALVGELARMRPEVDGEAVVAEWRDLYRVAWADFHRFLKGWSPGHWKVNGYSERVVREVVANFAAR